MYGEALLKALGLIQPSKVKPVPARLKLFEFKYSLVPSNNSEVLPLAGGVVPVPSIQLGFTAVAELYNELEIDESLVCELLATLYTIALAKPLFLT
ncbi:hypothetical protein D3C72_1871790 [compost metagenome]